MDDQNSLGSDATVPASRLENLSQPSYDPPAYVRAARESKPSWAMTSTQRRVYGIVGGTVILAIVLACIVAVATASGNASTSPNTSSQTGSDSDSATQAVPTATPNPTATPKPNAGLDSYIAVAQPDAKTVGSDLDSVGKDCSASDYNSCYADLQTLSDDVHRFQADLDANPAPPCLANVDKNLRTGLQLYDKGAQAAMSGIKQNDPTQVDSASSYFTQGTRYIGDATNAMKVAQC